MASAETARKRYNGNAQAAVIAEGTGYVILLIPNRIKEIKEAGRRQGLAEARAEARNEGRAQGLRESIGIVRREAYLEGVRKGRAKERAIVSTLLACHDRGEITSDQLRAILAEHYNGSDGGNGGGESD